jgi:hypothetical protein
MGREMRRRQQAFGEGEQQALEALWRWKARKGVARSGGNSSRRRRLDSSIDNNPRATLEAHYTFKGKIHALRQCIKSHRYSGLKLQTRHRWLHNRRNHAYHLPFLANCCVTLGGCALSHLLIILRDASSWRAPKGFDSSSFKRRSHLQPCQPLASFYGLRHTAKAIARALAAL